jgi:hypothetical protein
MALSECAVHHKIASRMEPLDFMRRPLFGDPGSRSACSAVALFLVAVSPRMRSSYRVRDQGFISVMSDLPNRFLEHADRCPIRAVTGAVDEFSSPRRTVRDTRALRWRAGTAPYQPEPFPQRDRPLADGAIPPLDRSGRAMQAVVGEFPKPCNHREGGAFARRLLYGRIP